MKNYCLFIIGALVIFSSCKSDDDNSISSANIEGKWIRYKYTYTLENGEIEETIWQHYCQFKKDYWQFNEDGTYNFVEYTSNCEIHTGHSGNGLWSKEGNILYVASDNDPSDVDSNEILLLNETTLKLKFIDEYDGSITIGEYKRE